MIDLFPAIIKAIIRRVPAVLPHLSQETRAALKAAPGYDGIRNTYWAEIYDAVYDYLTGNQPVTSFRNSMSRAMSDAFVSAAELGYEDGGGTLPMDDETLAWLAGEQSAEFGFIADLFSRLKEEWDGIDPITEAFARADGYTDKLDTILGEAKLRGAGNEMLTFDGSDGKESCPECVKLKGQRHRASWWVSHGLIPGAGNENFTCKGYNCEHHLYDDKGNEWTG
jgi:hypothetical protein